MSAGLASYRAKQKQDWRGWQWNRIVERLAIPVEEATVLYLCGPEDLDRKKAIARGFRSENLIAVDLSQENVQRVRGAGHLAICHDLDHLIWAWPADWPIDVVVGDFCAGLNADTHELARVLVYSAAISCARLSVVAVNLQRGRDAWSNQVRDDINDGLTGLDVGDRMRAMGIDDPKLHRGFQFFEMYRRCTREMLAKAGVAGPRADGMMMDGFRRTAHCFTSYRSSRVKMDSVVFRPLSRSIEEGAWQRNHPDLLAARRKISACRAVRTAKLRSR